MGCFRLSVRPGEGCVLHSDQQHWAYHLHMAGVSIAVDEMRYNASYALSKLGRPLPHVTSAAFRRYVLRRGLPEFAAWTEMIVAELLWAPARGSSDAGLEPPRLAMVSAMAGEVSLTSRPLTSIR